jgi:hypothetical protein
MAELWNQNGLSTRAFTPGELHFLMTKYADGELAEFSEPRAFRKVGERRFQDFLAEEASTRAAVPEPLALAILDLFGSDRTIFLREFDEQSPATNDMLKCAVIIFVSFIVYSAMDAHLPFFGEVLSYVMIALIAGGLASQFVGEDYNWGSIPTAYPILASASLFFLILLANAKSGQQSLADSVVSTFPIVSFGIASVTVAWALDKSCFSKNRYDSLLRSLLLSSVVFWAWVTVEVVGKLVG